MRSLTPAQTTYAVAGFIGFIILASLLSRFLFLNADFPSGITDSGALLSDEGFYANGAARLYTLGHWYVPGDINVAVYMPIGSVVHAAVFKILGPDLLSARMTILLAFLLIITACGMIVRKAMGLMPALLTALLLSLNFVGFAYSRLALMEYLGVAFVCVGLLVSGLAAGDYNWKKTALAALFFSVATLTKGSMIFSFVFIAYFAWQCGATMRLRLKALVPAGGVALLVIGGYVLTVINIYPDDFAFFLQIFEHRKPMGFMEWGINIPRTVYRLHALGYVYVFGCLLLPALASIVVQGYRRRPIVHVMALWLVVFGASLTTLTYGPPRYFLPLLIPLSTLAAIAIHDLYMEAKPLRCSSSVLKVVAICGLLTMSTLECVKTLKYQMAPNFSYHFAMTEIDRLISANSGENETVCLYGQASDTVGLALGIPSYNSRLGTIPLNEKLLSIRPAYLLIINDEEVLDQVPEIGGTLRLLGSWSVLGSYYADGRPLELYKVTWPTTSH